MADGKPDIAQVSDKQTTGKVDPSIWDEAVAVTGRPQDEPAANSTFADRARAAAKAEPSDEAKPAKKATRSKK